MSGTEVSAPLAVQYEALRTTAGVHLARRDVVAVEGPDAASYLQGQCSQDVASLPVGGSAEALLLSPQGKIEVYVRIARRDDDGFVIDTDAGYGTVVIARLLRFRLRTKVTMAPLDWACVNVRGPQAREVVVGQPTLELAVAWPGLSGVDLLGPTPDPRRWVAATATDCGEEAWEAARIEAGVPVNGREVVEGTIAAEVGLVDRTVSFTKGCFTGQELVARLMPGLQGGPLAEGGDHRRRPGPGRAPGGRRGPDGRRLPPGGTPLVGGLVPGERLGGGPGHPPPEGGPSRAGAGPLAADRRPTR